MQRTVSFKQPSRHVLAKAHQCVFANFSAIKADEVRRP
jgi:hypothetical protein